MSTVVGGRVVVSADREAVTLTIERTDGWALSISLDQATLVWLVAELSKHKIEKPAAP